MLFLLHFGLHLLLREISGPLAAKSSTMLTSQLPALCLLFGAVQDEVLCKNVLIFLVNGELNVTAFN